jgi:uncharacterized protein (DUF342 family)
MGVIKMNENDLKNANNEQKSNEPVVDSYVRVRLEEKNVAASVEVVPPLNGGKEITYDKLKAALDEKGVCHGIEKSRLEEILDNRIYGREVIIARYTPPKAGKNGSIEYKFDKYTTAVPVEDEDGYVDYRELGKIRSIRQGTVIAEITPPENGIPGIDVLGREIAPSPTKKAAFTVGVGTVLSLDGLTLTASIDGHLVFEKNSFVVRKELDIKADIDFNTGNIEFLSDINVRGNVGEGFKVVSTGGNVTINGGVFSGATISATGNVTLKQVVNHATIIAGGNVNANFCEYCNIRADGDITASTMMICEVYCGGTIFTKGSKTGGLIGGRYTILTGMYISNNVGSPNYPITEISLGDNSILAAERERLVQAQTKREVEINDLTMMIDYLNYKKKDERGLSDEREELLGESVRKRIMLQRDIKAAKTRIEEIENLLENSQDLRMDVAGSIYPRTRININTIHYEIMDEWKNVSVFVDDKDEIHLVPM